MSKTKSRICMNALLIIFLLLVAYGCSIEKPNPGLIDPTAHPELVDQSWFTGQPCSAPCWQGLEPGKSSHDESLNTARRLTFIGKEEKMKPDDSWSHFYCKNPSKEPCMSMRFDKEVLAEVGLYPNYSMTLEQAVKYLGEPDFFTTIFLGELNPRCDFSFLWLKQRIELNTGDELYGSSLCFKDYRKEDKVPNDLIVNTVYINSTERMEEIIKSINLPMSGYMIWNWAGFSEQK